MTPRTAFVLLAALAAIVIAGCGGSTGGQTATVGDQTVTMPSDTHGIYGELETILDQLPYEAWYTKCVVAEVRKGLDPQEAEALAALPESERESKAVQIIAQAGPACEASHHLPVVDPSASAKELGLLRAGRASSMAAFAEAHGATAHQVACVENGFEEMSDKELIAVVNGARTVREGILLSVFKPCTKEK